MKKGLLILFILSSFNSKGTIHQIGVWGGYYQFVPGSITIQLGDTIEWEPFFGLLPMMLHTITSNNIPLGAVSFDQEWQMPADTFFQYIPQVAGLYEYVCTPHIPNGMIGEFTVTNVSNTQTYVPDDNFEQVLINLGYDNILDDSVTTSNIDTVTSLYVDNQNITDLTGIEDFTALTSLECWNNLLISLDVSQNTALTFLRCDSNQLTSLDINANIALIFLNCISNNLDTLDVSTNTALTSLSCSSNQLDTLDVSANNALISLWCNDNYLTSLDVSQNTALTYLRCENNHLTNLDVSQNTALTLLYCGGNLLTVLDVSNNTSLTWLRCEYNQIITLDVSNNLALTTLNCSGNQLTSLDVRNGNNTNMNQLLIQNNLQLYCINVDDAAYSNTNWTSGSAYFVIDSQHYFSNNCPMGNLNCSDSLLITDVIIDNTNLTMNIAIYNGYNDFLNYPHVAFTIDANGDTIQSGNINLFGAFNYDTTWYNYYISSQSLFPAYPLTSYFVYTSSLTFMSDTCVLIYNSTPTTILYPSYNNEKEIIKITDLLGRETKCTKNEVLFYIYDDGTVEKKIIIE
jgi:Leucine-rich repeat (LRR) protein/plastocyanin